MKPFLIQPVGELEYAHLNKPINYTPRFLTGLTNQKKITVRDEHSGKVITEITGLFYKDGGLYGISKDEFDITDRGISPIFDVNKVIEHEDSTEPVSAKIRSIDLVDNPRNIKTLLYNSATVVEDNTNNEGDNLGETIQLEKKITALEIEVNNAKKAEKKAKELLKNKENEFNKLKENSKNEYDTLKSDYDHIETKLENYTNKEATTVETIATELAGEDNELLEVYKNMSLEQLKVLQNKKQSKIDEEIKNKAKELSFENEEYQKVLEKLSLEQIETISKANNDWDEELSEKYKNDTGYKGAGVGQKNGYNKDGTRKEDDGIKTREDYNKTVAGLIPTKRPKFTIG